MFSQADSSDGVNEELDGQNEGNWGNIGGEVEGEEEEEDGDNEVYSGLRAQDLQEAKDQLLVETADMLHIPLFTAEALLRDNGKESLIGGLILLFRYNCTACNSGNTNSR